MHAVKAALAARTKKQHARCKHRYLETVLLHMRLIPSNAAQHCYSSSDAKAAGPTKGPHGVFTNSLSWRDNCLAMTKSL